MSHLTFPQDTSQRLFHLILPTAAMPVALHNLARAANAVEQMNKRRRTSGATLPCLLGGWVGEIGGENDEMEVDGECCDDEDELEEECGEGEEGEEGDEEIEERV